MGLKVQTTKTAYEDPIVDERGAWIQADGQAIEPELAVELNLEE